MDCTKDKVLVTGATGYIGLNLVKALDQNGIRYSSFGRRAPSFGGGRHIFGNVSSSKDVFSAVREHDVVVHSACLPLPSSIKDPELCFNTNVFGTYNLARACAEQGVKLLLISTSEVYGSSQELPIGEDAPKKPVSIYGGNKLLAEIACENLARTVDLKLSIVRFFNIYGPAADNSPRQTVETIFLRRALSKSPLIISGGRKVSRDFLYIDDCIRGLITSIERFESIEGKILNLASGIETSLLDLARYACETVGVDPDEYVSLNQTNKQEERYRADISSAKRILDFEPNISVKMGLVKILKGLNPET